MELIENPTIYFTDVGEELRSFVHKRFLGEVPDGRGYVSRDLYKTITRLAERLGFAACGFFLHWEPATDGETAVARFVEVPLYTRIIPDLPISSLSEIMFQTSNTTSITVPLRPIQVDGEQFRGVLHHGVLYLMVPQANQT